MDGLVSNTALVAGVGGGGGSPRAIVLAGTAGLIAGAISMALGEYTSGRTQNEQLDLAVDRERRGGGGEAPREGEELGGGVPPRGGGGGGGPPRGVPRLARPGPPPPA